LSGTSSSMWPGFILATVVALVTTGVILWLVRRNVNSLQSGK